MSEVVLSEKKKRSHKAEVRLVPKEAVVEFRTPNGLSWLTDAVSRRPINPEIVGEQFNCYLAPGQKIPKELRSKISVPTGSTMLRQMPAGFVRQLIKKP